MNAEEMDLIESVLCEIKALREVIYHSAIDLPAKGVAVNYNLVTAGVEVILGSTAGTQAFPILPGQEFIMFVSGTLTSLRLIAIDGSTIVQLPVTSLPNARAFRVGGDMKVRTLGLTPSVANTRVTLWQVY